MTAITNMERLISNNPEGVSDELKESLLILPSSRRGSRKLNDGSTIARLSCYFNPQDSHRFLTTSYFMFRMKNNVRDSCHIPCIPYLGV